MTTPMRWTPAALLVAAMLLVGCGGTIDSSPAPFPPPGWTPASEEQVFDAETLYNLVNGQADAFFAYGFQEVRVQTYQSSDGAMLRVEVWHLATTDDAYGLFTTFRGGTPVEVGKEGDGDPGRRLDFWQDRYLVRTFAPQPLDDGDLQAFAQALQSTLPSGGSRPALLDRLPPAGRTERSAIFFHEEISIQSYLWLGGENLLGLSQETDGILARYDIDGTMAYLLLVRYPKAASAAASKEALQASPPAPLAAIGLEGNLLGAVLGEVPSTAASDLLDRALQGE